MSVLRFVHPVLPSRELARGPARVVVDGLACVLFRDADGRAAALLDRCPHRFAPLSLGRVRDDGTIQCPYHGWRFDRDGRGRNPSQPTLTKCDATALACEERYGYVWIAERGSPSSPADKGLQVPRWSFDGYALAGSFSTRFDAPLHVALDNFSEDEHTPWVHTRLGWREEDAHRVQFSCEVKDDSTVVHYDAPQRPSAAALLLGVRRGDVFHNDWTTRFDPVRTIYRTHWRDPKTGKERAPSVISPIYFVPETERTTMLHTFVFLRAARPLMKLPPVRRFATWLARHEIEDDARFIRAVAGTPRSMKGMRLDRFDAPLVANHRLLDRIYFDRVDHPSIDDGEKSADASENPRKPAGTEGAPTLSYIRWTKRS